jgi:gentisate 1,2-dioxygenase
VRIPTPLYESLPWLYALAGALLIAASHELHSGALSLLLLAAGALGLIGGAAIWLRRRDFRATRAEYWSHDSQPRAGDDDQASP